VQLTSSQPFARVTVALVGATEVEVVFLRVEDPSRQAIAITVALEVREGDRSESFDLGAASAFPPEEPAPFVLPLPKEAQAAIAAHSDGAALLLRLTPVADQTSLRDGTSVALTIGGRVSR